MADQQVWMNNRSTSSLGLSPAKIRDPRDIHERSKRPRSRPLTKKKEKQFVPMGNFARLIGPSLHNYSLQKRLQAEVLSQSLHNPRSCYLPPYQQKGNRDFKNQRNSWGLGGCMWRKVSIPTCPKLRRGQQGGTAPFVSALRLCTN